ncbi:hypothetical protein COB18_01555 [Candidatus Kaiserbacteria bacterium]|nr:MAG: hypothetical protein COB18_01555 [Candidatus Kaiserbacteria bacterium]
MSAIIAFSISLGVLVLFFAFKLFEQPRSLPLYVNLRVKADRLVVMCANEVISRTTNTVGRLSLRNMAHIVLHHTATRVANTARRVEVHAQDMTRKMNRTSNGVARATRSSFLEEVETHKNGLDTESIKRETSLTSDRE